tara:strand:- start:1788 stop:2810 length:1023 start_codon:yes stop_codon:yes gene_type:complete
MTTTSNNDAACAAPLRTLIQTQDQLKMLRAAIKSTLTKGVVAGLFSTFVTDDNIRASLSKVVGKSHGKPLKNGDVDSILTSILGFNDVNEMYDFYASAIPLLAYEFIYEHRHGTDALCYYAPETAGVPNYLDLMLDGLEFEPWRTDENLDWNRSYDAGVTLYTALKEPKSLSGDLIYEDDTRAMLVIRPDNTLQKLTVPGEPMAALEKLDDWMSSLIETPRWTSLSWGGEEDGYAVLASLEQNDADILPVENASTVSSRWGEEARGYMIDALKEQLPSSSVKSNFPLAACLQVPKGAVAFDVLCEGDSVTLHCVWDAERKVMGVYRKDDGVVLAMLGMDL